MAVTQTMGVVHPCWRKDRRICSEAVYGDTDVQQGGGFAGQVEEGLPEPEAGCADHSHRRSEERRVGKECGS